MIEQEREPKVQESVTAEQIRQRKLNKKGVNLNILLIGENGTGKKSFINTLCKGNYFKEGLGDDGTSFRLNSTVINFQEKGSIPIKLRISVTKNYGFNLENNSNGDDLVEFLEREFQVMLEEEIKIDRNPHIEDNRVHVALYFLRTTGKGYVDRIKLWANLLTGSLNELDIENMKKIGSKVNLILVLSKGDALTDEEVEVNKTLVNESIKKNNIVVYDFLSDIQIDDSGNEEDEGCILTDLQDKFPFSIISSNCEDSKSRTTKWGTINIEDDNVCDFSALKNILFGSHLEEFKESTLTSKYEMFRCQKLSR